MLQGWRHITQGCNNIVVSWMYQTCWNNLATSLIILPSLLQVVNNLWQAWWHYQTCCKVVLTSLIQSWYNKNVTRLMTQGCNNIVVSWMYRTCWNNLAISLIISTRFLQVVNSLFHTFWQLGTSSANTTCLTACWQTCYKMRDFFVCSRYKPWKCFVSLKN
jgi:hypothetical protein